MTRYRAHVGPSRHKGHHIPRVSKLEGDMEWQLRLTQIPFLREYKFHPKRRWRFDFAIESCKVAIECEGGIWSRGRHTRGKGYEADCEKYNEAVCMGWKILRVTQAQIKSGEALKWVQQISMNAE